VAASFTIDVNTRLIYVILSGVVTLEDLLGGRKRMLADTNFDPTFSQIIDMRQTISLRLTGESVRQLAHEHVFAAGARRALVVPNDLPLEMARMFEIYRMLAGGKESLRLFPDMEAARRWLRLPANYPLP
jgi:hypothetical protein